MFSIMPRDTAFFDLFDQAAEILAQTAQAYAHTTREYDRRDHYIGQIRQYEHDCDSVVHATLGKLDKTFITPFDREDIHKLMKNMDDVIDEIDAAAKRLVIYRIKEPTTWLTQQTDVLSQSTRHVAMAVKRLRSFKKGNGMHDTIVEIHRLENVGDEINHSAAAELYSGAFDSLHVLKWKEIYDLTERAIDRCEDIADTIEAIVLKNT
jgi:predicted phosphate transport protein (TIGR00153 family)